MRTFAILVIAAAPFMLWAVPTIAAPDCSAKFRVDTTGIDNPADVERKGTAYGPITQLRIDPKTGAASYCGHGDACYPAGGLKIIAPCTFTSAPDSEMRKLDPTGEWIYAAE